MNSRDYVHEKLYVAVDCLCAEGSFASRLQNATASSLIRLNSDDLEGELAEDLGFVLGWTKENLKNGSIRREPNEIERGELVEKMLHIMLATAPESK